MQMIRSQGLGRWACAWVVAATTSTLGAAPCIPIELNRYGDYPGAASTDSFSIKKPGYYCLTHDIVAERVISIPEGGEKSADGSIGTVWPSDVEINLQGHTLAGNALGTRAIDAGNDKYKVSVARLTVRDGILTSRASCGVKASHLVSAYFGSILSDFTVTFGENYKKKPGVSEVSDRTVLQEDLTEPLSKIRNNFPVTGHRLLNLTIEVGGMWIHPKRRVWQSGIAIQGAGNVIRGNTITTYESHAGVYLFGPNQVIENNTIIFKGSPSAPSGAPIKIHAADNSIIRNNTIVVEGWFGKPEAAITIVDSKNVVIENNRIIGVDKLYKIWDEQATQKSSVVDRGNQFPTLWNRLLGQ